ncbi:MAG: phosphoglycerate dehydrogenase, partial [Nitrospira sp.]
AVGQALGDHNVNIARMQCARAERGGNALLILGLDAPLPLKVLEEIKRAKHILSVTLVSLSR